MHDYINMNLKQFVIGKIKIVNELPIKGTGKIKRNKVNKIINFDIKNYKMKELSGGLRCKTFLIENDIEKIYQKH
ncbi:unknown [Mycoplasma sp. CAG:776]|nr:unknown [Mycoplasma sp. CAG:776]